MSRLFLSAIAAMLALSKPPVLADNIALDCTLRPGNRLPLGIAPHDVAKGGVPLRNLDQKSISIGPRYITFKQAFGGYNNAWRINRSTGSIHFRTVLKPNPVVVLDETGFCEGPRMAPQRPQPKPPQSWAAIISAMLR